MAQRVLILLVIFSTLKTIRYQIVLAATLTKNRNEYIRLVNGNDQNFTNNFPRRLTNVHRIEGLKQLEVPHDFNILYIKNRTAIVEQFQNRTLIAREELTVKLSWKRELQSLVKRNDTTISLMRKENERMLNLHTTDCILPTTFDVLIEIATRFEPKELILIYHPKILSETDLLDWKEKFLKHRKEFKFIDFKIRENDLYEHTAKILKEIGRSDEVKLIILFTPLEITNLIFNLRAEKFRTMYGGTWMVDKAIYPEANRPPKMVQFQYFKYRIVSNYVSMRRHGSICEQTNKIASNIIEEKLLDDQIRMIRLWQLKRWRTVYKVSYENQQYQLSSQSIFGKNQKISVVSRLDEPFLMENRIACDHFQCEKHIMSCRLPHHNTATGVSEWRLSKCRGYVVDLLYELAVEMHTEFELYVAFDGEFGRCLNKTTNEWTGMIGDVMKRKADLAIQGITITEERYKVIDFTIPYLQSQIEILTLKEMPKEEPFSMYFLELYDIEARYVLVPLFLLSILSVYVFENIIILKSNITKRKKNRREKITLRDLTLYFSGSVFQKGDLGALNPKTYSGRFVSLSWSFCFLVLTSLYTALLTADRVVTGGYSSFHGMKDQRILNPTSAFKFGTINNTVLSDYFRTAPHASASRIHYFMKRYHQNDYSVTLPLLERSDLHAFFAEHVFVLPHVKKYECKFKAHETPIPEASYGAVVAKGSPLKDLVSQAILKLNDAKILKKLKDRWFTNACEGNHSTSISRFNLIFFSSLFMVLLFAAVLSVIVLGIEIYGRSIYEKTFFYEQVRLIKVTKKQSVARKKEEWDYFEREIVENVFAQWKTFARNKAKDGNTPVYV